MNTAELTPPCVIRLHRPWWQPMVLAWSRLLHRAAQRSHEQALPSWRAADLRDLEDLSPQILRDIGAPTWLHERQVARRRAALDLLRL